ncbi:hypothetical protein KI387_007746, partial [Taxus chinensis]
LYEWISAYASRSSWYYRSHVWTQDDYQRLQDVDLTWTHVVDHWWKRVLTSYTLEYAISMYSFPEIVEFEFLREPKGSFLH